jgi:hypothetical protein
LLQQFNIKTGADMPVQLTVIRCVTGKTLFRDFWEAASNPSPLVMPVIASCLYTPMRSLSDGFFLPI